MLEDLDVSASWGVSVTSLDAPPPNCMRLTTFNYHYTSAYSLEALDSDKNSSGFTFKFTVQAQSDAHIKLSSTPDYHLSPVTIEIVLGAGANSFSVVRRKPKKTAVDLSNNTPFILSKEEMRPFTLVTKGELLVVYDNSSSPPILSYEDSSVVDMAYIFFGAWNNIAVEWSFDCKDAEVPEPPPTDPVLRLKRTYWSRYDPFNPPVLDNSSMVVDVSLSLIHVNLNAKDALFTMRGRFDVRWIDQKLQWNPKEYGNITHLNFKHRVIWMPEFELLDTPKSDSSILEDKSVRLYHNGSAKWSSLGDVETWCDVDVTDWPADQHVCHIHIGLRSHPETIQLTFAQSPNELETTGMEWEVISITADESILINANKTSAQSFKLRITMKRIRTPFMLVFFVPLFVSFGILMSSYVIAPQHKCRLALVTSCVVVLNLLLILEDVMLPALPQGTPRIMKITCCLLMMAVLQLVFHSFNVHLVNLNSPAPAIVKKVAKKPWMKYLHQGAHEALFSEDIRDQEFHQCEQEEDRHSELDAKAVDMNKYHWALVSRALDMVTFLLSFFILPFLLFPM